MEKDDFSGVPAAGYSDVRALIHDLNERLISSRSVTAALLDWCKERDLSQGPITAVSRRRSSVPDAYEDLRSSLGAGSDEHIDHRCVCLKRGDLCLVEADNWFVPTRLPLAMRNTLEKEDVPFGTVITPLQPYRRTLSVWFGKPAYKVAEECPCGDFEPEIILEHQAVVFAGDGIPLAVVREQFRSELLLFA